MASAHVGGTCESVKAKEFLGEVSEVKRHPHPSLTSLEINNDPSHEKRLQVKLFKGKEPWPFGRLSRTSSIPWRLGKSFTFPSGKSWPILTSSWIGTTLSEPTKASTARAGLLRKPSLMAWNCIRGTFMKTRLWRMERRSIV